jgi:hypothetical protein
MKGEATDRERLSEREAENFRKATTVLEDNWDLIDFLSEKGYLTWFDELGI